MFLLKIKNCSKLVKLQQRRVAFLEKKIKIFCEVVPILNALRILMFSPKTNPPPSTILDPLLY